MHLCILDVRWTVVHVDKEICVKTFEMWVSNWKKQVNTHTHTFGGSGHSVTGVQLQYKMTSEEKEGHPWVRRRYCTCSSQVVTKSDKYNKEHELWKKMIPLVLLCLNTLQSYHLTHILWSIWWADEYLSIFKHNTFQGDEWLQWVLNELYFITTCSQIWTWFVWV